MKKSLLLLFVFLSFGSTNLLALSPPRLIEIVETNPGSVKSRSLVIVPQVTFYADQNMLEVRLLAQEYYVLKVADATTGTTVFISQLITDGTSQTYMLPALQQGSYTLTIESPRQTYTGSF